MDDVVDFNEALDVRDDARREAMRPFEEKMRALEAKIGNS
jgi:hypothetical protein